MAREDFNASSYAPPKDYMLEIMSEHSIRATLLDDKQKDRRVLIDYIFDFMNRTVVASGWGSSAATSVFTFAQFDEGSIEWHYNQLKKFGRNPRLPAHMEEKQAVAKPRPALQP